MLSGLGWDEEFQQSFADLHLPDAWPGRVARVDLGACTCFTVDGETRAATGRDSPAVGDWVALGPPAAPDDPPRVVAVLPRRTAFVRHEPGGPTEGQVLAANAEMVFVVHALDAPVRLRRIERFLALAWQSGASPVVVLTKADLADDANAARAEVEAVCIGAPVHVVSAATGVGLDELSGYIRPGHTVALLGASGAGKSTLVNRLAGADVMAVGEVRDDRKGRHTTTHRQLVPMPNGALVLDTPGLRALALWDAQEGFERTFADVEEVAAACRFADCRHRTEPGCAIRAALAGGQLSQDRVESWEDLQRELAWLATRQDARLASERRKTWQAVTKVARQRHRP